MWTTAGPGIETVHVQSASEFISLLRRSHPTWWEGASMPWAFRGHSDESWPLLPSAWRPGDAIIEAGRRQAAARFDRTKPEPKLNAVDVDAGLRAARRPHADARYEATREAAMAAFAKSWRRSDRQQCKTINVAERPTTKLATLA
jgi:hypothetical protein